MCVKYAWNGCPYTDCPYCRKGFCYNNKSIPCCNDCHDENCDRCKQCNICSCESHSALCSKCRNLFCQTCMKKVIFSKCFVKHCIDCRQNKCRNICLIKRFCLNCFDENIYESASSEDESSNESSDNSSNNSSDNFSEDSGDNKSHNE